MIWTPERNRRQGQVVARLYRRVGGVPCARLAVIADGLPGSDKPAVLATASVDSARYLTVRVVMRQSHLTGVLSSPVIVASALPSAQLRGHLSRLSGPGSLIRVVHRG